MTFFFTQERGFYQIALSSHNFEKFGD